VLGNVVHGDGRRGLEHRVLGRHVQRNVQRRVLGGLYGHVQPDVRGWNGIAGGLPMTDRAQ
jgi:hypothetical protein